MPLEPNYNWSIQFTSSPPFFLSCIQWHSKMHALASQMVSPLVVAASTAPQNSYKHILFVYMLHVLLIILLILYVKDMCRVRDFLYAVFPYYLCWCKSMCSTNSPHKLTICLPSNMVEVLKIEQKIMCQLIFIIDAFI